MSKYYKRLDRASKAARGEIAKLNEFISTMNNKKPVVGDAIRLEALAIRLSQLVEEVNK